MLAFEESDKSPAIIKVVGVGGGGMNAIERMIALNLQGVQIIAMNTDKQVLNRSSAPVKVHLGEKITGGKGAGARPDIGAQAAMEDRDRIQSALKGADMVFITAGMGGGTGTGASPIVADVAKELGVLTVGVVTLPFSMEGTYKMEMAKKGQANLKEKVDTLITIPNDSVLKVIERNTPFSVAYKYIDDILAKSVMGISDIINKPGFINVDFADLTTVMRQNGDAIIGLGDGEGDNRIADALKNAISHPLLEGRSIEGAKAVLINVAGGSDLTMHEYHEAQSVIHELAAKDAIIIAGLTEDRSMQDKISVTVIATGFSNRPLGKERSIEKDMVLPENGNILAKDLQKTDPMERISAVNKRIPVIGQQNPVQQNIMFPNVDTQNYNVPAFMRGRRNSQ